MAEDGNTGIAKVAVFFLTAWFVAFLFGSLGEDGVTCSVCCRF